MNLRRGGNPPKPDSVEAVIDQNIQALIEHRKKSDAARTPQGKIIDALAHFTGSACFLGLHAVLLGAWLLARWLVPGAILDLSFNHLAGVASIEAIFLSSFLMIHQNRMRNMESRRENLDLQISLLIEHELTRVARISELIAIQLGVDRPELLDNLKVVKEDVPPEKVLDQIEAAEKRVEKQP